MSWILRAYMLALLAFLVVGMLVGEQELFASILVVLSLGIAWIEIRHLRVMVQINKDCADKIEGAFDELIAKIQRSRLS